MTCERICSPSTKRHLALPALPNLYWALTPKLRYISNCDVCPNYVTVCVCVCVCDLWSWLFWLCSDDRSGSVWMFEHPTLAMVCSRWQSSLSATLPTHTHTHTHTHTPELILSSCHSAGGIQHCKLKEEISWELQKKKMSQALCLQTSYLMQTSLP